MARRIAMRCQPLEHRITPDATPHNLAVSNLSQHWSLATLVTANDNWSGVPSVVGFLGDDTIAEGIDPQAILIPYSTMDVIANQGNNAALTTGGVAEFDGLTDRVVALQGDSTSDAPNLVVIVNTTGRSNISISYTLRDIDFTADNAIQPVALQYRIGNSGNFTNVPAGFVADATTGPNLSNKITFVNVTMPSAVDNQPEVQFRIITANAIGNDEWVGVDDIVVCHQEFAINTYTTNNQTLDRGRTVAVDAGGNALVVWRSHLQDGSNSGIYGQRLNSSGAKVGLEFQVNSYTTNSQNSPEIAVDGDGDFLVIWDSYGQDTSGDTVVGQRFDSNGAKVGTEIQINTYTTSSQAFPSMAVDASGNALVAWASFAQDGANYGIFGQWLDSTGGKVGSEFQINTYTTANQLFPSVAVDSDGDALVVWASSGQDGNVNGIYGQRVAPMGGKVGAEFRINSFTTSDQNYPSVAMDSDGDTVVVWQSNQDGSSYGIYGQRLNSVGAKVGGEFQINTYTSTNQTDPSVAVDTDGDFLVVWSSVVQDGGTPGVYGQRLDSMGSKVGAEFQVHSYTSSEQTAASVSLDADGDAIVVWQSTGQDGNLFGVFGQRFASPNPTIKAAIFSSIQINDGSPQRSLVTSLQINFDNPLSFLGSPSSAFTLVNQKTTIPVTLAAVVDPGGKSVTLTFTGGSIDLGGSLADGRYTLTILGNQFTGNGFDGNGDGIPGDNYQLIGTPANGVFRLFGDADGNGSVTAIDFNAFRLAYGTTGSSIFDFDNDGQVSAADFNQFRLRYGSALTP